MAKCRKYFYRACLYDIWALKEWHYALSFRSRNFISIFPVGCRIEKYIAMHLKRNRQKKDMIFNVLKGDSIIGNFFVTNIEQKPAMALGLSDKYQRNKPGYFFVAIMRNIFKIHRFERLYLTTMHQKNTAFNFYKKLGFELIKDTKIPVPRTVTKQMNMRCL